MTEAKPLPARAIELAKSGGFRSNKQLKFQLKNEGYRLQDIDGHFNGLAFRRQVKQLRREAIESQ